MIKDTEQNIILTHWNKGILFYHPWIAAFISTTKILISNCILFVFPRGFNKYIDHLLEENNLFIYFVFGWKHFSRKQLSRHDDNKPSVAGMVGKEVALSKQYFPKKSWAVCQAVMCLSIFRYSFFIRSLKDNFLMRNTLMIYGSLCFSPRTKLYSVERAKRYVLHPSMPGRGAMPHQPHTCFMVWFCNSCHMNCLKRDDRHIHN